MSLIHLSSDAMLLFLCKRPLLTLRLANLNPLPSLHPSELFLVPSRQWPRGKGSWATPSYRIEQLPRLGLSALAAVNVSSGYVMIESVAASIG